MSKNEITQHVQNCFVQLSIIDDDFLSYARKAIPAEYFGSKIAEDIIKICYTFYDMFKVSPKDHIDGEIDRLIKNADESTKTLYKEYQYEIAMLRNVNKDYVFKHINDFVRTREIEKGLIEAAKLIDKGELLECERVMLKVLKSGIEKYNSGLKYFASDTPTYYNNDRFGAKLMDTGIPHLDEMIGGIRRGKLIVLLGGFKGKKTWGCVHLGKMAVLQGKKVLHITHEMGEDEVEQRYDMSFGALVSSREEQTIDFVEYKDDGTVAQHVSEVRRSVYNAETIKGYKKFGRRMGGDLRIKKYAMGTCSMEEIERLLDYLEATDGFVPDLVINDYVEIMKLPKGESLRDQINTAYMHHKRIADERGCTIITVSQVKREALRKKKIRQTDLAEDIRKLGNVDIAIALSQDEKQAIDNVMRLWVLVNRAGKMDCGCYMSQNISVGQLCIQSWPIPEGDTDENGD